MGTHQGAGSRLAVIVGLAFCGALAALLILRGGPAPVPPAFAEGLTLDGAIATSVSTGKPVVAFATADWCGPCQVMKRSSLSDRAVDALLRDRALPVYVDVDKSPREASALRPTGLPTTFVLAGDTIVAQISGVMPAEDYAAWLGAAIDLAGNAQEVERIRRETPRRSSTPDR